MLRPGCIHNLKQTTMTPRIASTCHTHVEEPTDAQLQNKSSMVATQKLCNCWVVAAAFQQVDVAVARLPATEASSVHRPRNLCCGGCWGCLLRLQRCTSPYTHAEPVRGFASVLPLAEHGTDGRSASLLAPAPGVLLKEAACLQCHPGRSTLVWSCHQRPPTQAATTWS